MTLTTVEISQDKWREFCERVEQHCHGNLIRVERLERDGTSTLIADALPLRHLVLNSQGDPCNARLVIEAGPLGEKPFRLIVLEPIHLVLRNGNGGERFHRLQITAEEGSAVLVFHPGLSPQSIEGLAA